MATAPPAPSGLDADPSAYLALPRFNHSLDFHFLPPGVASPTPATVTYALTAAPPDAACQWPLIVFFNGLGGHRLIAALLKGIAPCAHPHARPRDAMMVRGIREARGAMGQEALLCLHGGDSVDVSSFFLPPSSVPPSLSDGWASKGDSGGGGGELEIGSGSSRMSTAVPLRFYSSLASAPSPSQSAIPRVVPRSWEGRWERLRAMTRATRCLARPAIAHPARLAPTPQTLRARPAFLPASRAATAPTPPVGRHRARAVLRTPDCLSTDLFLSRISSSYIAVYSSRRRA
ncbi:hypothetical protein C8R47DRAFT_1324969 [Mycena vitilis]|nr:hypothetical protein C8R47DRAFT_1324969 [Mycena vitilis]